MRKLEIVNFDAVIGEAEIDADARITSVLLNVENLDLILPGFVLGEGLSITDVAKAIVPYLHVDLQTNQVRMIGKGIFGK